MFVARRCRGGNGGRFCTAGKERLSEQCTRLRPKKKGRVEAKNAFLIKNLQGKEEVSRTIRKEGSITGSRCQKKRKGGEVRISLNNNKERESEPLLGVGQLLQEKADNSEAGGGAFPRDYEKKEEGGVYYSGESFP